MQNEMRKNVTFKEWLAIAQHTSFKVGVYSRPHFVAGHSVPANLNGLTIGQLIDLSQLGDTNESLYAIAETVMGLDRKEVEKARAVDVVMLVGWVSGEVEKINKLFESAETNKPTAAEKKAGIDTLRFGLFGMLDWYAVRMGISDHDKVLQTPWLRIYKCMDMDNKKRAYEIRLQKIHAAEIKAKR